MMKCINFDDKFADFASQWMKDHGKEYRNYDAMEAASADAGGVAAKVMPGQETITAQVTVTFAIK
jgi:uncharacterized protein YggE